MESSSAAQSPCLCLRRVGRQSSISSIGDDFPLFVGSTTLGRSRSTPEASQGRSRHIHLDSSVWSCMLSRQHARLVCSRDRAESVASAKIFDMSINGVFVNDVRIGRPTSLQIGDVITLGHARGAALATGAHAKQADSEFRFRLEAFCTEKEVEKDDDSHSRHLPASVASSPVPSSTTESPSLSATAQPRAQADGRTYASCPDTSFTSKSSTLALLPTSTAILTCDGDDSQHSHSSTGSFYFSDPVGESPERSPVASSNSFGRPCSRTGSSMQVSPAISCYSLSSDLLSELSDAELVAGSDFPEMDGIEPMSSRSSSPGHDAPQRPPASSTHASTETFVSPNGKRKYLEESRVSNRKRRNASLGVATATAALRSGQRRLQSTTTTTTTTKTTTEYHDTTDRCASVDCQRPGKENVLDWVQCDTCQLWYHVQCVLRHATTATVNLIQRSEFSCGCV